MDEQPTAQINAHEIDADWLALSACDLVAFTWLAARREQFASKMHNGEAHLSIERHRINNLKASAAARGVYVNLV